VQLELFFDYSSPFGYLATTQIERIAHKHGAELVLHPFLLGALFDRIGTANVPIAAMSEAKRRYYLIDMQRWAEHWGVPLVFPSRFPLRTVKPLRLTLLAPDRERMRLVHRLMRLCWVENGDPDDTAALARCLDDVGLDRGLADRTSEAKQALFETTEAAALRGVPGVPTIFVANHMFWGQDRLDFVERVLEGWRPSKG
jgi:2-hydroxychromene-2-carboxylate isomerase